MTMREKPAETQFSVHDLIRRRWSPRAFADRAVSAEQIGSLLDAARWAASCNNAQPWRFVIATREQAERHAAFVACLAEGNRTWALYAPVLMLTVAKTTFDDGTPNRHAWHDVGQAAASLAIQATAMGLVIHQMAGFSVEQARATFEIPAGYEPVAAIAIGYTGDPNSLPDYLRERELAPRSRRPVSDVAFAGRWEATWPPMGAPSKER
ncbi:MAG: nitroreductase family protein [Nitrospiraceae bacterium]